MIMLMILYIKVFPIIFLKLFVENDNNAYYNSVSIIDFFIG